jgi:hypothetical protein
MCAILQMNCNSVYNHLFVFILDISLQKCCAQVYIPAFKSLQMFQNEVCVCIHIHI